MEELSIYNSKFIYVKGEDNSVADALSRLPYKWVEKSEQPNAEKDAEYPFAYHTENPITVFAPKSKPVMCAIVAALVDAVPKNSFKVTIDEELLTRVKSSYKDDPWCQKLLRVSQGLPNVYQKEGLWYIGDRLVVPKASGLREIIYRIAHDNLGHFGFHKCYDNIRDSYFWPNMRKDLEEKYIPGCQECQRNKAPTTKPVGPLHP